MLELARRKAPEIRFEPGNALDLPYDDDEFDAATVGFGARNFSDLAAACPRWRGWCGPAGAWSCSRSPRRSGRRCRGSSGLWFDRVVPALGRLAGDSDAYTLPAELGAPLPRPAGARRASSLRPGCIDVRWILTAGGIIAIHAGTVAGGVSTAPAQLPRCWRRAASRWRARWSATEARLAEVAGGHGAELATHAAGTLAAGGKRLRPMLVFLCGGERRRRLALRAAVAVELLHMATLVHDDVLDRRRCGAGAPTVFAVGGRAAATATGDLLFSRAFAELASTRSAGAVRALSRASSALARGELMQRADAWSATVTPERYLERCELKTASLFAAACSLGRAAGRAGRRGRGAGRLRPPDRPGVPDPRRRARRLGPAERTGKQRGTDLLDGTVTLPLILARGRDPELAATGPARGRHEPARGGGGVRPDRRHGRAGRGARAALAHVARGQGRAGRTLELPRRQRDCRRRRRGLAWPRAALEPATPRSLRAGSRRPAALRRSGPSPRPCSRASGAGVAR